jgi:dihydroxyacetone kinase-like protein
LEMSLKKICNDPGDYVDDMLDGMCEAHPGSYRRLGECGRVLVRAGSPLNGRVGIVTGGGSGHLPIFHGYIGHGFVDACAVGNVFAGPRVDDCLAAMRAVNGSAGVLQIYGNYGGDRMNFDMAREFAELEGIEVASVRVADDIASASRTEREKRRAVAGLVYVYKLAGAIADQGAPLAEVARVASKAADRCHSIGLATSPCIVPEVGTPAFEIGANEVAFGMGIHGEPGIWRGEMRTAKAFATEMLDLLLKDAELEKGSRISILVNSLGATPLEELYIIYKSVSSILKDKGIDVVMPLVGRYATSMEMAGVSLTLCVFDPELEQLLQSPASCPFWSV